ncbi:hypothetical protein E2C01_042501 [Portunus trituberculatus]|uniref:Uncharacterized protein n=1 Tax=Portunus trituberculatus TaxID=210409 RepID=A0A5B7FTU6_PORTR|nr:hypothetical protein [Portunus trituberculatus]
MVKKARQVKVFQVEDSLGFPSWSRSSTIPIHQLPESTLPPLPPPPTSFQLQLCRPTRERLEESYRHERKKNG